MNTIYRNILAAFTIFAAVSCYKDLGSYDYEEINEIVITTDTYTYPLGVSSTITIEPVVTQTLVQGTDNLAYEWKLQSGTSWEVVGDGPVYELKIGPEDVQPYSFIFSVTDTGIGITTYAEITVNPVSAFDQSWFILQNVGGQAVLGSVGGEGDVDERAVSPVLEDVSLSGTPRFLGIHPYMNLGVPTSPDYVPLLGVFTSSDRYILNGFTMLPQSQLTYDRIVYGSKYAGEQNMPSSAGEPQIMKGQRNGFAIVAGGIVWYAVPDQYALMYPVKLSSVQADMFDYEAGDICLSYASGFTFLMYDARGGRFLFYDSVDDYGIGQNDRIEIVNSGGTADNLYLTGTANNQNTLMQIADRTGSPNVFDPNSIPSGYIVDNMAVSTGNRHTNNVLALGHVGNTFHIYEFCMAAITGKSTDANCSGYWEVGIQGSVDTEGKIPAATSRDFTRQFFYAAGNGIYRVDLTLSDPAPVLIWSSDNAADVITGLKFKSDNEDVAYDDENGEYQQKGITSDLGAIVRHSDGSCDLVEFQMTSGGEIEMDDEGEYVIRTFTGFTDVVDFVFSYREYIR